MMRAVDGDDGEDEKAARAGGKTGRKIANFM